MISSRYNPQFRELKSLLEAKGAKKTGRVLVSGRKIVPEFAEQATTMIAEEGAWPETLKQDKKIVWLDRPLFRDLDIFGTHFPLAILRLPEVPRWTGGAPKGLELVLSLQDPANLGAVLRSAEAFGVRAVILLKECAFAFHPKAVRASSGSCFRLALFEGPSQKEFDDAATFGLDTRGVPFNDLDWPTNCRLMAGEEGQGLPERFSGQKISIPMNPKMDSLNAAVAASLALFAYRYKYPMEVKK